ncbi:hypothetical protein PCC7424_5438 (plasmid) [Gloeothece citriformis PCC 7424]|uniref:Uncharacterized protein n=1 Tax=Gloeothece citriformis (strain PCC 7424) TaxID=65393 RepID=B7KMJ0_GLOC7|nr:DUF6753 family protein [Gloeothece citriformis]ACK74012.1 hypothetical protein PCC7424_5438 [Gloeothece citriformis PCC 7424]
MTAVAVKPNADVTDEQLEDLWESLDAQTKSLLVQVLDDKDVIFRAKVLNLVVKHGLNGNDPLFLVLIAVGSLQVMLEEAPAALEITIEEMKKSSYKASLEAIAQTQKLVAASVRELIGKTEAIQMKRPSKVLIPGLALFTAVFSLGAISGICATVSFNQLASSGHKIATKEEAVALAWAQSKEGKSAKNIYEWNKAYLDSGKCIADMDKLGIKLTLGGTQVKSGFCALWVVPPNQRQY